MTQRSGLTALYLTRDLGYAVGVRDGSEPKSASKALGDTHTSTGRRGRALWTWLEDHDQVVKPAAYAVWCRPNDDVPEIAADQLRLSFVPEMFVDEVQVPILRGSDTIIRGVLGSNYPHHHAGIQAWAREHRHERHNLNAVYAAILWHWASGQFGRLAA